MDSLCYACAMKSGFAVLIGRSNVGKSTLLNTLVGTKIAAVTHKPQTTRNAIHGVRNLPNAQIVFVDTPGLFKSSGGALAKALTRTVEHSLEGIDMILYVVDPTRSIGAEERALLSMIAPIKQKKVLIINKIDESEKPYMEDYRELADQFDVVFELSALKARHIVPLLEFMEENLPEGQPMYDDTQKTNITDVFWVQELIREKIFMGMGEEVPYSTTVEVDNIEDKGDVIVISARILTTEERYKKMLIGVGGRKIKELGQAARKELTAALNKKIYLDLQVDVDRHWVRRLTD